MTFARAAAVLSLVGTFTAFYGTYLMTLAYHPFKSDVAMNFFRVVGRVLTFRARSAQQMIDDAAFFGEMNSEDRGKSLTGIYYVAAGFFLQFAGAICAVVDVFK